MIRVSGYTSNLVVKLARRAPRISAALQTNSYNPSKAVTKALRCNNLQSYISISLLSKMSTSTPSIASIVLATGIFCTLGGFYLAQALSLGLFSSSDKKNLSKRTKESWPNSYDVTLHPDSSDEELMKGLKGSNVINPNDSLESDQDADSEDEQGELGTFTENNEECKLVLVVRTDLGMGKGTSPVSQGSSIFTDTGSLFVQGKSPPKPPMLPSPATPTSSPMPLPPPFSSAGKLGDRRKLPCNARMKRNCSRCRRRRSAWGFAQG